MSFGFWTSGCYELRASPNFWAGTNTSNKQKRSRNLCAERRRQNREMRTRVPLRLGPHSKLGSCRCHLSLRAFSSRSRRSPIASCSHTPVPTPESSISFLPLSALRRSEPTFYAVGRCTCPLNPEALAYVPCAIWQTLLWGYYIVHSTSQSSSLKFKAIARGIEVLVSVVSFLKSSLSILSARINALRYFQGFPDSSSEEGDFPQRRDRLFPESRHRGLGV